MGRKPNPIWQYNGKTGIFIREYPSISSAAKIIGTSPSNLKYACELEIRCGGYLWRYADRKKSLKIITRHYRRGGKKVRVYKTRTGSKTKLFALCQTISEAVNLTGISHTTIRKICRGNKIAYQGYTFEFVKEEDKWNFVLEFDLYNIKYKSSRPYCKSSVKLTKDNQTFKFKSIAEASRELNINYKSIINVLAGRWNTAGGYSVERI